MNALTRLLRRIRSLVRRRELDRELDDELAFHLEMEAAAGVRRGASPELAQLAARRLFGGVARIKDECRDARGVMLVEDATRDVRIAMRSLRRTPGFTLIALLTVALGIGANTAIFSVVRGVLLRPLPYPDADRLVRIWQKTTDVSADRGSDRAAVSPVDIDDWRAQRRVLAELGGYWFAEGASGIDLTGEGEPQRLSAAFVTPGFFATLGLPAVVGRLPRDDEMVRGADDHVVVLAYGFWKRQFAGASSVIGKPLTLGGESYTVVGVASPDEGAMTPSVEIFIPVSTMPDASVPRLRQVRWMDVIGRMRSEATIAEARTEVNAITGRLAAAYPEDRAWGGATVEPLLDAVVGEVRPALLVLMGAVAVVLLASCVNLASLLLARATTRGREMAVRMAMGAGRGRLVRQMLAESLVLAAVGGLLGLGLAEAGAKGLVMLGGAQLPRGGEVRLDGAVVLFASAISLLTGIAFGLVPALRASAPRLHEMLKESARDTGWGSRHRLRAMLVVGEVALAVILVAGAGLVLRSFARLVAIDPGFRPDHIVGVNFTMSDVRHSTVPEMEEYYTDVLRSARAVPGVISVAATRDVPLRGGGERYSFVPEGMRVSSIDDAPWARVMHVSDGFFRTLEIPLLAGRDFGHVDRSGAPAVVVVNETLARRFFPGASAVGRTLDFGGSTVRIIGVVGDVRQIALEEPATPMFYLSNLQNLRVQVNLLARTRDDPIPLVHALESAIRSVDGEQTITSVFTLDDVVRGALARPRLLTVLLGLFGGAGLVLGALGIYGVLSYLVGERRREIGVRLALGAEGRDVLRTIVSRGLRLATVGTVIGVVGALALTRLMASVLYEVEPNDPLTFGGAVVVLMFVALLASALPARRAARTDPAVALRGE